MVEEHLEGRLVELLLLLEDQLAGGHLVPVLLQHRQQVLHALVEMVEVVEVVEVVEEVKQVEEVEQV